MDIRGFFLGTYDLSPTITHIIFATKHINLTTNEIMVKKPYSYCASIVSHHAKKKKLSRNLPRHFRQTHANGNITQHFGIEKRRIEGTGA